MLDLINDKPRMGTKEPP